MLPVQVVEQAADVQDSTVDDPTYKNLPFQFNSIGKD